MKAKNIDEVIDLLEGIIQNSAQEENTLGYFAALYHKVTVNVKEKLNTNYFDDDKRMEQLDVVFANRYLDAYHNYKNEKIITHSWKTAFDVSSDHTLIVLQHLLLGMNAHINLDLGIAAAQISTPQNISELKSDFHKINEILSTLVDEVQNDLSRIWPRLFSILKMAKKADNHLIDFSMSIARDGAWKFAEELASKNANEKTAFISTRDKDVAKIATIITKKSFWNKIIFLFIRFGEKGKISDKINTLKLKSP